MLSPARVGTLVVLVAMAGCVARVSEPVTHATYRSTPRTGDPAPRPPAPAMGYDEAIRLGYAYCQQHGYPCELKGAEATGSGVWQERFNIRGGLLRGHLRLDYDAFSRRLVRVDDRVQRRGEGGGRDALEHDEGHHGREEGEED